MTKRLAWVIGALVVSTWAACNCGHDQGVPCNSVSDCAAGQSCVAGLCGTGDGGTGNDGGPGSDGGPGTDGGPADAGCVNFECRQVACPDGGTTTVTGKVYDPSGQVPLYNAMVYVPNGQIQPFPPGASCDRCGTVTSGSPLVITLTGSDGAFTLNDVPTGSNIPLVIQIGRWRRQVTLPSVAACSTTPIVDVNMVRLPRNKSEGDIPLMAIATGQADPFECLLRKMGIADSEFTAPDGGGRIHYYYANGIQMATPTPAASTLWSDAGTLMNYDVVLLPCEGGPNRKSIPVSQNIVNYTSAGGRVFTTHYGYVWLAFSPDNDPFPTTGDWRPQSCDSYSTPLTVAVDQTFPKGASFAEWLVNVGASTSRGSLSLVESRHDLFATDGGAQQWLSTNIASCSGNPPAVEHMTFNTPLNPPPQPDGGAGVQCGRVVYSDFHVSAGALSGQPNFPASCASYPGTTPMTAQEKALVFMLFDVSACIQSDNTRPSVCQGVRQNCSVNNPCCTGLVCKSPAGTPCASGDTGCRCGALLN